MPINDKKLYCMILRIQRIGVIQLYMKMDMLQQVTLFAYYHLDMMFESKID